MRYGVNYIVIRGLFSVFFGGITTYVLSLSHKAQPPAPEHHNLYLLALLLHPPSLIENWLHPTQRLKQESKKIRCNFPGHLLPYVFWCLILFYDNQYLPVQDYCFASQTVWMSIKNSCVHHCIFIICILSYNLK